MKWAGFGCAAVVVVVVVAFMMLLMGLGGLVGLLEPPVQLAIGWIWYLMRVVPEVTVNVAACVQGVIAMVLLVAIAHGFFRWLAGQMRTVTATTGDAEDDSVKQPGRSVWRLRWTCSGVAVVILMFIAGISMAAIVHQVHWLVNSPEPVFSFSSGSRSAARRAKSLNNLKQMGLGLLNHEIAKGQFPAGATFGEYGERRHGWVVQMLPYMEAAGLVEEVNMELPWDHPDNAKVFQTRIRELLNPRLRDALEADADGYALSHYMANSRVVGGGKPMSINELTDGTSQTILAGEVNHGFKPWGHPLNFRDPAQGLGNVRSGFGGPTGADTTTVLMADGSVHLLNNGINPKVLKALATPAAGDQLSDEEWPE